MAGDIVLIVLVIVTAYLLGSIPSAFIVGRLLKGVDIREAGDGRLGAAVTFRRVGLTGAIIVGLMDITKGMAAVLLAQELGLPLWVVLLAGLAVVVGHNWSIFLRFKGGKGALTTYGVLVSLMFWQFFIALALAGIAYLITHKTGMATGILLACLSLIVWFTSSLVPLGSLLLLVIMPIFIAIPMVVKHITMPEAVKAAARREKQKNKRG